VGARRSSWIACLFSQFIRRVLELSPEISDIDEVVVLNGIALVTKYTQMMLKLHRLAGLEVSRKAKFKMPSAQVVKEFTNMWNQ
jgi:hypothetical protein